MNIMWISKVISEAEEKSARLYAVDTVHWLEYIFTLKVAGSLPDVVDGFFN